MKRLAGLILVSGLVFSGCSKKASNPAPASAAESPYWNPTGGPVPEKDIHAEIVEDVMVPYVESLQSKVAALQLENQQLQDDNKLLRRRIWLHLGTHWAE